jgi:hypothetical protein
MGYRAAVEETPGTPENAENARERRERRETNGYASDGERFTPKTPKLKIVLSFGA